MMAKANEIKSLMVRGMGIWPTRLGKVFLRALEADQYSGAEFDRPCADLGCGDGSFAALLGEHFDVGIDVDENALEQAAKFKAHNRLVHATAQSVPLEDGSLASIVCNSVLEHVQDLDGLLREMHRLLRLRGRAYIVVPLASKQEQLLLADEASYPATSATLAKLYRQYFNERWRHDHHLDVESWCDKLRAAGFQIDRFQEFESRSSCRMIDALQYCYTEIRDWANSHPEATRAVRAELAAMLADWATKDSDGGYCSVFIEAQKKG